jgi:hypothetical protein
MLSIYWHIGKYIVINLQNGNPRAAYNTRQLKNISAYINEKFNTSINHTNILYMRKFFLFFPALCTTNIIPLANSKWQFQNFFSITEAPLNTQLTNPQNTQAGPSPNLSRTAGGAGGNTQPCYPPLSESLSRPFGGRLGEALTWSHYIEILKSRDKPEANFYHQQTIQNKWSTRQLKQQMKNNLYYTVSITAHHLSHENPNRDKPHSPL